MLTFFLKLLFGSTILLLAALILNLIFRKASATVRHRIWAGSLVGLLILPIVSPLLPSWSFLPSRVETAETPQELALKPQAAPQNVTPQGLTDRFVGESQPPVELPHHFANEPLPEFLETSAVIPPGAEARISDLSPASVAEEIVDETTAETQESQTAVTKFAWLSVIAKPVLVVWCVGAMFLLMQLALSIGKVTRELSRLNLQELPLASKSRRKSVLCAVSHRAAVPFTCRVIRPVIVLPECSGQWSDEQRQAVFAHELAHIARNDVFWQVFSQVICAIYWFHPLVWLAANRIRIERELACDDLVLLGGEKPSLYAEVLLQLASGLHQRNNGLLGCMVAMARQHTVKTRIKAILNPNICRKQPGRVATLLMFLVAVICIAFAATASPFAKIQPVGFLNLDAISSDRTIHGEKNSQTIDCCNEIAKTMARVTGKKWYRSNSTLSLGNASLVAGQIRVFSADKPLLSGSSWYRITVDEGVLIEAASEKGFEKATEHFAELVEFEGNRPRIAKGEYTGWNRKKKLTDDDIMNLVAIRQDAEKVTIRGRVTMPDGKPAKHITVDVRDFAVIRDEDGHYGYGSGCAASSPGRTNDQGYFEFEAIPGGILIVGVYREPVEENLVSDLVCCFTPEYFSNESLDIKLQPGVPVTIRVKHEDGSPVEGVIASWERMFAPPIKTYGNGNLDNNCNAQDTRMLTNGETTLYVVPGEYELNVQSHSHLSFDGPKKLSIVEGERYEFEHTIPNPVRVRLLQVNGDPLANRKIKLMHTSKTEKKGRMQAEIVDVSTDANGIVSAYLWDEANYVFATSEDERFGIIKPLSHEDAGKTVDVMLERSTEFLVDIRNRNTQKPVANKELQCQIGVSTQRGSHRVGHVTCANKFKTDNDGVARFHLPPIPDGDQHLKYEPLLEQELDVRRTDSTISFGILTSGDDSEYEPLPESDNDGEKNAPPPRMVEVRGRVTYPDGSPGKDLLLYSSVRSRTKNEMGTEETDADGYYSVKVPEDGFFVIVVNQQQGWPDNKKPMLGFASPAVSAYIGKSSPDVVERDIILAEGVPLRGRLTYENGEPAIGKTVSANVYPFGRESIMFAKGRAASGGSVNVGVSVTSNEQGEYVIPLMPGEYVVSQSDQFGEDINHTVIIRVGDEEHVLDFVVPAETTGIVLLPDGSPAGGVNIWCDSIIGEHSAKVGGRKTIDADGSFRLQLTPFGNMLTFYTKDKSLGRVVYLRDDERLEHQTVTLAEPEIGRMRLINEDSGKPIAGLKIRYNPRLERNNGNGGITGMPLFAETDGDGYAELPHLFVGGVYELDFVFEPQRQYSPSIEKQLTPSRPGETVDYGEVVVHGDFSDFEPQIEKTQASAAEVTVPEFDGRTLDEMLALLAKKETMSDEEKSVLPRVLRALRGKQEKNEPLSEEEKFLLAEALRVHSENIRIATMERQALSVAEAIEKGEPILSGRVLDTEGNPIADACLNLGGGYYGQLYTDEQGNYQVSFPGEKSEKPLLLVLAKGYATAWVECDFDTPLEIRMERGETIRLRVVDSTGSPIPDVFINLRKYRSDGEPISMAYSINRDSPFERMMKTDVSGYWEMNVMPEDKIGYGFSTPENSRAMGLYSSSLYLKPGEEIQEIVLPDRITISGKVSDAETGEPIPNLNRQVVAANYQWHFTAPKNMPNDGSYVFQIQDCQPEYTLEFSAEGYFPLTIPFRQEDGDQKFDLTMKPDRGLSGTLLDVSGKPAGGAVYLTKATNKIVKNGNHSSTASARRSGTDNQDMFFNCDNNGQFSFEKSFEECHLIVTNSQQGFAAMTREEFEKNGNVIQLRPWGRIEVTTVPPRELEIVLVPVEGQDFPNIPVLVPGESTRKANFNGQAAFESAFPDAKYYVKGYANMTGGTRLSQGDWLVARGSEPVSVGPGETLNIELLIIGRPVRLTPNFPGLDQLIQAEGTNERGIFSYRNIPLIAELHRTDDDLVLSGTYSSGRLTFYTVEPGTYRLTIRVEGAGGEAENVNGLYIGEQPIEIGEISDGWSVDVLDLGEMRLGLAKE